MNTEAIKILVEKYFEGETSLQEEAQLSEYFNSDEVVAELKQYQPLFHFFKAEKGVLLNENATERLNKIGIQNLDENHTNRNPTSYIRHLSWWQAAAAVFILGVSSYFITKQFKNPNRKCVADNCRVKVYDETDDPQKAFEEVQVALKLVSKKMKKGTDETTEGMKKVKHATDDMDKVIHLSKINQ